MPSSLRTVLIGSVESTAVALETMVKVGWPPMLVVTLPPSASGRHSDFVDLTPRCEELGIAVHHTRQVNDAPTLARLAELSPDYILVFGWSQILEEPLRRLPLRGVIGAHPAPLPRMRGRAVIPWTILMDEKVTAASVFWIDSGVDSGPLITQRFFPVAPDETAASLYAKHMHHFTRVLEELIPRLGDDLPRIPQDESLATWCARRRPEDGLIDWQRPAAEIGRLVRAVGRPYPGAFTYHKNQKLILHAAVPCPESWRYVGIPGQIQAIEGSTFIVMCGDSICLRVTEWEFPETAEMLPLRNHIRFREAREAIGAALNEGGAPP